MSDNDASSVASGGSTLSVSLVKKPCSFCNKDFQVRSLFNHIRKKHRTQFEDSLVTTYLKKAGLGKPIAFFYDIEDDRGEPDTVIFYGCLSSNKGFLNEYRALDHFKKNPKDLKEHNKQLAVLLKELKLKAKPSSSTDPQRLKMQQLIKNNDPALCRSMWSYILHLHQIVDKLMDNVKHLQNETNINGQFGDKWRSMTVQESLKLYEDTVTELTKMKQGKCLLWVPLSNLSQRLDRLLCFRDHVLASHEYRYKTDDNPGGMILNGTDEFGYSCPEMPQVDF